MGRSWVELHAHSTYSFLDGASEPQEMAEEAARLGIEAIALTDHDGFYGVVKFTQTARELGVGTVFGSELSLGLQRPQMGVSDPDGTHLLVLARDPEGYRRLSRAIAVAQMAGEKTQPVYDESALAAAAGGHWVVLTGCRKGSVRQALTSGGTAGARRALDELIELYGREHVMVELTDHAQPLDTDRNDALFLIAQQAKVGVVATTNAHVATPDKLPLATALASLRGRSSMEQFAGWLPPTSAHLRSGDEMAARFARYPGVYEQTLELGRSCTFGLDLIAPDLPYFSPLPPGHTEATYLRQLVYDGAVRFYGPRDNPTLPSAYDLIEHELALIEQLNFPGYFLIVWDIVRFCRESEILCQGRGSAANSVVCYTLGITCVDAARYDMLFERFLSPERKGYPDIDVDIESDRREEAIQYVYGKYGRDRAAQVANVISYRGKSAAREMSKSLGYDEATQTHWSKRASRWGPYGDNEKLDDGEDPVPPPLRLLASQVNNYPRHLGIHSGGMVICDRPIADVVPVEWARMKDRSVIQWDKDDAAEAGLVKFDLLGLGMLSALKYSFEFLRDFHGVDLDLPGIPDEDPEVYDMLCAADTIGVFQVESRAQMATLPRLRPRNFYDLVVEVALIRPGPIQGGSVHPYIRRKNGREEVTYPHPLLEPVLEKTLGVPLFQEQLMEMAICIANFTPGEADQLRKALSSKRSVQRISRLKDRLYEGMTANGVSAEDQDMIYMKLLAFADFGFPESHAMSFAYLVYASSWLKHHYPAAFTAALLKAQPMGFYSPQTLVADARRHGVETRGPDVNVSQVHASLESKPNGEAVIRMGLKSVRSIGESLAEQIVSNAPYLSIEDLTRRVTMKSTHVENLATAGALAGITRDRHAALWLAGPASTLRSDQLELLYDETEPPELPAMTELETSIADIWMTGVSPGLYPTEYSRERMRSLGCLTAAEVREVEHGTRVRTAGAVTHRQRPGTANGTVFLNLEDETGLTNVICQAGVWAKYRDVASGAAGLMVRGIVEKADGVTNLLADRIEEFVLLTPSESRDFR